ncbi:MAG: hypothetical protein Q9224_000331, partial [Gallowayella concinna]
MNEEEYYPEASYSLSPELGASPEKAFTNSNGNGSKTQAAFEAPTPSIEFELPAPEGGWPDEVDDEVNNDDEEAPGMADEELDDEINDDDEGAPEAADEEAEYVEIVEEEGEYEDQEEDDQHEILDVESTLDTNDTKLANRMGIEASSSSSLIFKSQSPATSHPTTQALLANTIQEPDLTLADPEGG